MNKMVIILAVGLLLIPAFAIADLHGDIKMGASPETAQCKTDIHLEIDFPILVFNNIIYGNTSGWGNAYDLSSLIPSFNVYTVGYQVEYHDIYIGIEYMHSDITDFGIEILPQREGIQFVEIPRQPISSTYIFIGLKW